MPKISVIIPCYNVEKYLSRCLDSLLKQTIGFDNLEVILVDDCSQDHTWDIISKFEHQHPENTLAIHLEENMRQGGARNVGLSYASSDYVGYIDSDDWIEPNMYEDLFKVLTEHDCEIAFCRLIRDNGTISLPTQSGSLPVRIIEINTDTQRDEFIAANPIGKNVPDKLFKRDFLLSHPFIFPEHMAYEDIYFGALFYQYATKVAIIDRIYYHYSVNEQSTVLTKNQAYFDHLCQVNYLKWEHAKESGLLDNHYTAVSFDFIMTFFLIGMKTLCLRYEEIPFNHFEELKEETLKRVPDYKTNPYCNTKIPDYYKLVLMLLDLPVTPGILKEVQKNFLLFYNQH